MLFHIIIENMSPYDLMKRHNSDFKKYQHKCKELTGPVITESTMDRAIYLMNLFDSPRSSEPKSPGKVAAIPDSGYKGSVKGISRPRSPHSEVVYTPRPYGRAFKKDPVLFSESGVGKSSEKLGVVKGKIATYTIEEKLGEGGFGSVYKGRGPDGMVAIKKSTQDKTMKLLCTFNLSKGGDIGQEIKALKMFSGHPNIVCIKDYAFVNKDVYIIMEYCEGNLYKLLKKSRLSEHKALTYLIQMAKGLQHIHQKGLIHRDMKPQNILLSSGICKIADFGLATFKNHTGEVAGTDGYIAPESYTGKYGPKTDIYALGFILWDMLSGIRPDDKLNPKDIRDAKICEDTRRLLCKMIDSNPDERPTAAEVLKIAESILPKARKDL